MKKILLIATVVLSATTFGFSQNRSRFVFDNFATSKGVEVVSEARKYEPIRKDSSDKKSVKKLSKKTMSVTDAESLKGSGVKSTTLTYSKVSMIGGGGNMRGFTTGDAVVDGYITTSAARYGMDPLLIYAQMSQESGFKKKALSNKGASGLMQLMPPTARRFGVTNIYDPQQNIDAGIRYMRWLLDKFDGDVNLALAGYNAGEGAVMKYGNQIPPYNETQEYVRRITARYNSIRNPNFVRSVKPVSVNQISKIENRVSAPLTTIETITVAVRLPDGRMRLVNQ
jgi:Transglycosylase SLT domain